MAFSACKVPINCRLQAVLNSFHELREMPRWAELRQEQRDSYNEMAIAIDEAAIRGYDELLGKMVLALDERRS